MPRKTTSSTRETKALPPQAKASPAKRKTSAPKAEVEALRAQLAQALRSKAEAEAALRQTQLELEALAEAHTAELSHTVQSLSRKEAQLSKLGKLYAVLSRVNEVIVRTHAVQPLYQAVCEIVAGGGFPLAWIGQVQGQQVVPAAWWGPAADYLKMIKVEIEGPLGQGPTGTCIRENRPVVNDDVAVNPVMLPWRASALRFGLYASAAFPLCCQGQVVAALTLYAGEPKTFDADQVGLLEALTADLSYALDALSHEQLRQKAEQALVESEARYRLIIQHAPAGIYEIDFPMGHFTEVNDVMCQILGYSRDELLAMTAFGILDAESQARFAARVRRGQSGDTPQEAVEYRVRTKDGRLIWTLVSATFRWKDRAIAGATVIATDITGRKQVEEALQGSEARYHALFDHMTEAFALHEIILDAEGVPRDYVFLDLNPAFERLTGLRRDAVIGQTVRTVLPGVEAYWIELYGQVALTGQPARFKNYSADLQQHYEVTAFCPAPNQFAVIFMNITERVHAEQERQRAEQVIRAQNEQLQVQNEELAVQRTEVQAQNEALVAQEEELRRARNELEARVRERTAQLEAANVSLQGEIGERRRAEEMARQNAQRLAVLAQVSEALVAAGPLYRAALDEIVRAMARLIGDACILRLLSDDGQRLDLAACDHVDPAVSEMMRQAMATGSAGVSEGITGRVFQTKEPAFLPSVSPDDLRRQIRPSLLPSFDQFRVSGLITVPLMFQTNVLGTLAIFRAAPDCAYTAEDLKLLQSLAARIALAITNARLYQDLENALAQEQAMHQQLVQAEKLGALGRMVSSVAHELNNPLQTITNCLYLTAGELPPDSVIHQYLEMADSETQRLVNLVAQLRELYRPHTVPPEMCDLAPLLKTVHALMAPQLQSGRVQWLQPAALAGYRVCVIPDRIKQVLINVATNAIEAMQPAGGQLRVALAPSADGRQVGVRFEDTGPGIPPENLSRLFEPFFTTKPQGLGLGLAICYEIAQQHGGQLTAESQLGQGAVFTVWLPLVQPPGGTPGDSR